MSKGRREFQGKVIAVDLETVRLPNGRDCELEIVRHPGGAATVAINEQNQVCLLRQYRHVADGWLWELPAGKLEPDESPIVTAQRELQEEAGVTAGNWSELGAILSSPGVFQETIHLYLARELTSCRPTHEADEVMEVHWVALRDALDWAKSDKIRDAKTIIGLFRAQQHLI